MSFRLLACTLLLAISALWQQIDPSLYSGMRWRQIGPFRAGRVSAVSGVPGNDAVYYMGTPGGGVWKTEDGGVVWKPIFDSEHVASIGAVAVAPSNANIVYVGTGDVSNVGGSVNQGKGVYKSTDAGKTWQNIGLTDSRHIGTMWVDPKNADVVVVAALGHTFAPNEERGVFKTVDGGKTWRKVLYKDDVTGAIDVVFAADNSKVGFAALWGHYTKPGTRYAIDNVSTAGIYKTSDGGDSWTEIKDAGIPSGRLGRIGLVVSPNGQRVFAIVAADRPNSGLYRSDDGGTSWQRITSDPRIQGSGYFSRVFLDPKNADVVYVAQTSLYRSEDGGKTFVSYKGAPGGDDNHALWIDPTNSDRLIMASDQGATISMDGGKSWSSWYNQPTGQIYHLSTDNRFPYWVYGTQQDSGSIGTLSRGDYGEITFMDWDPVGGYEFGYIVPDPLNPNLIYAGGPGRGLVRVNKSNRQIATVSPNVSRDGDYRTAVNPPIVFSPQDPHVLYWCKQYVMETRDGGVHWKHVGADLTARPTAPPEAAPEANAEPLSNRPRIREEQETVRPPERSAVNTLALSAVKNGEMWAGTTNGLVQLTRDGGSTWNTITPPGLSELSLISLVEASHFEAGTAYVAVDRHEENDFKPHIYRTRDFGKTWKETVTGIPDFSFVRAVREDPVRRGLLYAGTETAVFVSFDDGEHWGPLQLNMPTTSVRDLVVHGDDLVVATYGRAFWILDNVTPLRQINEETAKARVHLFDPAKALRVRLDLNGDTPIPPEMPAGQNPPNGALIDYYLSDAPKDDVKLAIYDDAGKLVREFSSKAEQADTEPPPNVPMYWVGHSDPLQKRPGMNRFVWDLRYPSPPALHHDYAISALFENTPAEPQGPLVVPGNYQVELTVNGHAQRRTLTVALDPRVDVSNNALAQQLDLQKKIVELIASSFDFYHRAALLREALAIDVKKLQGQNEPDIEMLRKFDANALKLQGQDTGFGGGGAQLAKPKPTFALLNRELSSLESTVDLQDAAPTPAMATAYQDYCRDLSGVVNGWNDLLKTSLPGVNGTLAKGRLADIPANPINNQLSCQ